ncbi:MAG: type II toxin-antitoxin system HicB family antitoxin [Candidatus Binatia bacterium]
MPTHRFAAYFEPLTDGGYQVVFPAFPEIVTFGRTLAEARRMAKDALRCHIEGLIKDGLLPPGSEKDAREIRKEEISVTL